MTSWCSVGSMKQDDLALSAETELKPQFPLTKLYLAKTSCFVDPMLHPLLKMFLNFVVLLCNIL